MSKTFYANGNTGTVAIMEGNLDMDVLDNPTTNSDKLYFHSNFLYMYKIGSISNTFNLPSVTQPSIVDSSYDIGQIYFPEQYAILPLITYNGVQHNGSFLISSLYQNCRYLTVNFYYANPFINFRLQDKGNAFSTSFPAYTINVDIDVYSAKNPAVGCSFSPSHTQMGSFDSDETHLKFISSGFPLHQKQTISFNVVSASSNMVSSDYSTDGYGVEEV